jgi:hypothetical protein
MKATGRSLKVSATKDSEILVDDQSYNTYFALQWHTRSNGMIFMRELICVLNSTRDAILCRFPKRFLLSRLTRGRTLCVHLLCVFKDLREMKPVELLTGVRLAEYAP